MRVSIIALLACSVLAATAGLSCAEQGLPEASTLGDMGLSGLQVISDDEALDIRGFGYDPWHGYGRHAKHQSKHRSATAFGRSWAQIAYQGASAGTEDGFAAMGRHLAQGEHGSEAGIVITHGKGKMRRGGRRGGGGQGGPPQATNGGGNNGGGMNGHGGGYPPKPKAKSARVFAGGFSIGITK